jgi:hypothetical protein
LYAVTQYWNVMPTGTVLSKNETRFAPTEAIWDPFLKILYPSSPLTSVQPKVTPVVPLSLAVQEDGASGGGGSRLPESQHWLDEPTVLKANTQ